MNSHPRKLITTGLRSDPISGNGSHSCWRKIRLLALSELQRTRLFGTMLNGTNCFLARRQDDLAGDALSEWFAQRLPTLVALPLLLVRPHDLL